MPAKKHLQRPNQVSIAFYSDLQPAWFKVTWLPSSDF